MVLASLVLAAYVPRGARYQRGEELIQGKTFEVYRVSHLIRDHCWIYYPNIRQGLFIWLLRGM